MREIKYRQKLKPELCRKGESFHYWGFIGDGFTSPCGKNDACGDSEQYTGLKDKNGVEVFEGDILDFLDWKAVVRHNDKKLCFELSKNKGKLYDWAAIKFGLVIGNIHQNPELLEE